MRHGISRFLDSQDSAFIVCPTLRMRVLLQRSCYKPLTSMVWSTALKTWCCSSRLLISYYSFQCFYQQNNAGKSIVTAFWSLYSQYRLYSATIHEVYNILYYVNLITVCSGPSVDHLFNNQAHFMTTHDLTQWDGFTRVTICVSYQEDVWWDGRIQPHRCIVAVFGIAIVDDDVADGLVSQSTWWYNLVIDDK